MKAVLINPFSEYSRPMPSLGLFYLSGYLKSKNHDALIIDLWSDPLSDKELKRRIEEYNPDLIGITFLTALFEQVIALTQKIKGWFPDILLVAGGPHPSALPKKVLEEKTIDMVVIGEGEITLAEIMGALESRKFENIDGIAYKKDNEVVVHTPREYIKDLDLLPFPDLNQLNLSKIKSSPPYGWYGLPLMMVTSRGCPGRCTFCCKSVFGNSIRAYSAKRTINEIKYWKKRLPIKEIRFYDDDFTLSKRRTFEICELMLKENINLPWTCTTRVDFLTKELLVKMKEAGLYLISLGVESGSERILKLLKKGYKRKHIRNAFQWCHDLNIATLGYFLVGNPGETVEDIKTTIKLQKEIKPSFVGWGILEVFPGSQLFEESIRNPNIKLDKEKGYCGFYRKDMDEKYLRNLCLKAMVKNYLSVNGAKSILKYLHRTKNFSIVKDHLWIKFKNYSIN